MGEERFCYICRYVDNWPVSSSVGSPLIEPKAIATRTLINTSRERMDDRFHAIISNIRVINVHDTCYKNYTHPKSRNTAIKRKISEQGAGEGSSKNVRVEEESTSDGTGHEFDWANKCFICTIPTSKRRCLRSTWREAKSCDIKESFLEALLRPDCQYDEVRRQEILERLRSVSNFDTIGAVYHKKCYNAIVDPIRSSREKVNLTANIDRSMDLIVNYIDDHEHTQFTVRELIDQLPDDVYKPSEPTVVNRLKIHYGDQNLVVTGKQKSSTLICVSSKGLYDALNESWQKKNQIGDSDIEQLKKAAEIIVKEIRQQDCDLTEYPQTDTMLDSLYENVPPKLQFFLESLILNTLGKKEKRANYEKIIASTAHVLMSAICPRHYLSPLLLSLAVALHREFGTKNMIEMFHSCGLTASYKETKKYEMSAAKHMEISLKPGTFI